MSGPFVHSSVGLLAFVFPNHLSFWPLVIAANFPDIEYFLLSVYYLIKTKKIHSTEEMLVKTHGLHSLLGSLVFALIILYLFSLKYGLIIDSKIILSVVLGLISHLLLDLPSHKRIMLFWPFKVIKNNPFIFKTPNFIKKKYKKHVYSRIETTPFQYIFEYNWLILSRIVGMLFILVFLFFKKPL